MSSSGSAGIPESGARPDSDPASAPDSPMVATARRWGNRDRFCFAIAGIAIVLAAIECAHFIQVWDGHLQGDWEIYRNATQRWMETGSYFLPSQLTGPYQLAYGDVLYPPCALALFVPMSFLPGPFWVGIPLLIMATALKRLRPTPLAWATMAVLCAYPVTAAEFVSGNPLIWMNAALFAAVAWGSPAALVMVKPTLLPFALIGLRSRAWWVAVAALTALSLLALPLTLDWVRAVRDAQSTGGAFYSVAEWPVMLIPLAAWWGSSARRQPGRRRRANERMVDVPRVPESPISQAT